MIDKMRARRARESPLGERSSQKDTSKDPLESGLTGRGESDPRFRDVVHNVPGLRREHRSSQYLFWSSSKKRKGLQGLVERVCRQNAMRQ